MRRTRSPSSSADGWRNDIGGDGALTKRGTGTLTLTGDNRYGGGTSVEAGTLVAAHVHALGRGDVRVTGGTLRVERVLRIRGSYGQEGATALQLTLRDRREPALAVDRRVLLGRGSVLSLRLDAERPPAVGTTVPVLSAASLRGGFSRVALESDTLRAVPVHTSQGLSVRLVRR